jgi:hypothetical protein
MPGRRQLKFPHHAGEAPTSSINISGVIGPSGTLSPAIADLIPLPSLTMSLMAFWLMASDLRWVSQAWLRAVASCSRDMCDCSSSVLTPEKQTKRQAMAGLRKRGRQSQDLTLTLKLLRQAPDGAFLLNNLEEGGVPLLLRLRQFCDHPGVDHTRPCDHDQQIRMRQGASSEQNKERKMTM